MGGSISARHCASPNVSLPHRNCHGKSKPEPARTRLKPSKDDLIVNLYWQDVAWSEEIKRWLPGTWADGDVSDKAVKSDNSPFDFKPWYRRIQLVFPCSAATLGVFERLAARQWRGNVVRSLFQFISATCGPHWQRHFFPGDKRKLEDCVPSSVKRARLSSKSSVSPSTGGG